MPQDTALTVDSATLRIVATYVPDQSAAQLEFLRGDTQMGVDIPDAVREELLGERVTDEGAYYYLAKQYVLQRSNTQDWDEGTWRSLISRFSTYRNRQPSTAEVSAFLSAISLCNTSAVAVARRVDGGVTDYEANPGPVLVKRLTLASPLDVALDLAPIWGTPTAVAAFFYFVRFAFGADLDVRAHRENKRADYLEAAIRAQELEVRHREMLESMAAEIRRPAAWAVERLELTDD